MAARRTRVPVTNTPPPMSDPPPNAESASEDDGSNIELLPGFAHEGLDRFRDSGDMSVLRDASFNDWEWIIYRLRSPREMQELQTRQQRILICKLPGPLDITQVQQVCGGGVFEFRGFWQTTLRTRFVQELAGPLKHHAHLPPTSVSVSAPAAMPTAPAVLEGPPMMDRRVIRLLRRQQRQIEALTAAVAQKPSASGPLDGLGIVLELVDRVNARVNPHPEANALNQVVDAFQKGMDLRAQMESPPESSITEKVLDRALPAVERLLGTMIAARAAPQRRPAPAAPIAAAAVTSRAEVLEHPAADPAPAPSEPANDSHRWATAIESLARAITEGDDPVDFAVTLEAILQPDEIALLESVTADEALAMLRANAGGRFEVLTTDAAGAFIAAVHAELKTPPE